MTISFLKFPLYYSNSSSSCRKAKAWLDKHQLPYKSICLNKPSGLTKEELIHILSLTEKGTDEIISKKSQFYQTLNLDFECLTVNELLILINEHRSLLRRPIIVDEKCLQVGFNDAEIRKFIPCQIRKVEIEGLEVQLKQIFKIVNNDITRQHLQDPE